MMIGEQLQQARQARQLSQEQVAEQLAVSRQTISNWETEKSYPDIERVLRLAELYQLSLDELLRRDPQLIHAWQVASDQVKLGRYLAVLLGLNLLLTLGILYLNAFFWLTVSLFLGLVVCVSGCFYVLIKLI
ncbi:helix-turn-helix domain-containing protein [Loigolactobacillus bifermentans]|nr:helix-turn-helix domain-containing protein [Loigolactobacillus bifermentans]